MSMSMYNLGDEKEKKGCNFSSEIILYRVDKGSVVLAALCQLDVN